MDDRFALQAFGWTAVAIYSFILHLRVQLVDLQADMTKHKVHFVILLKLHPMFFLCKGTCPFVTVLLTLFPKY
jgi:hypothetical protein